MPEKKKKTKPNFPLIIWIIAFLGSILFDTVIFKIEFLPRRWKAMIIVGISLITILALLLS